MISAFNQDLLALFDRCTSNEAICRHPLCRSLRDRATIMGVVLLARLVSMVTPSYESIPGDLDEAEYWLFDGFAITFTSAPGPVSALNNNVMLSSGWGSHV